MHSFQDRDFLTHAEALAHQADARAGKLNDGLRECYAQGITQVPLSASPPNTEAVRVLYRSRLEIYSG